MQGSVVRSVLDLAARQHGAITPAQLRRLGVSAKAQRTAERDGWLVRDPTGVLVTAGTHDTWTRRLHVGALALDRRGWVSHDAAAQLYGFPMTPSDRVEFTVPRAARGFRTTLTVHTTDRIGPNDVRTVAGLRTSSPERTIADLARVGAPEERITAMIAHAQRRGLAQLVGLTKSSSCSTAPTSSGRRSA